MDSNFARILELATAVGFILALKGLSAPKTARNGNLIGALAATIATAAIFFQIEGLKNLPLILGAIVVGVAIGWPAAKRVQMTQMPQMVALFNGVGGGAAALVSVIEFLNVGAGEGGELDYISLTATVFTVVIGSISFTGSFITFMKLQELMTSRPVVIPLGKIITLFDDAGYIGVVATNCEQTYHRYLRPGEEVSVSAELTDVVGPKNTALGEGFFITQDRKSAV